jgi:DNA-binding NarL/FixJ family response regulator
MKKILVIEDEPDMLRNMLTILRMEGYATLSANNGRAGVEVATREQPDMVLCDVMMPELDGYGVLESLRAEPRTMGIPFLFLTAKAEKRDLRTGMNLGADDYLTKPVDAAELIAAIETRFERHRERERVAQAQVQFEPDFTSARPLEALGLTEREAEVLLWVAQGKSNPDISTILGTAESTVKKHLQHIFEKLGLESRNAAAMRAIEVLSSPAPRPEN